MRTTLITGHAAILTRPRSTGGLGVVIAHDAWGLRPLLDQQSEWLTATYGWTVAAPAYNDVSDCTWAEMAESTGKLNDADVLADLSAAKVLTGCERVAVIGFCAGGRYALLAPALGDFSAAISLYGGIELNDAARASGKMDPIDALRNAKCPVLDIVAGKDPHARPEDHIRVLSDLAGIPVLVYPEADHGFAHEYPRIIHATYAEAAKARYNEPEPASDGANAWAWIAYFLSGG
jgi:carboxymethylenebutenolidase